MPNKGDTAVRIQTYSVVVGSKACNACCPFCVSKMTPSQGVQSSPSAINWRNFAIGCRFAKDNGVSTVLLTGKGEPTLSPQQITDYLEHLGPYGFPLIELQTNAILFWQERSGFESLLRKWYQLGLSLMAVSVVDYVNVRNQAIFQPQGEYLDLPGLIGYLHDIGYSVRLSCTLFSGGIDTPSAVNKLIDFARSQQVEQLSIRPVKMPQESQSSKVAQWVAEHRLSDSQLRRITDSIRRTGTELMILAHGARVYDVRGQNLCLTDCLTTSTSPEEVRQLIFFPDGHLRYDWQFPGAILL